MRVRVRECVRVCARACVLECKQTSQHRWHVQCTLPNWLAQATHSDTVDYLTQRRARRVVPVGRGTATSIALVGRAKEAAHRGSVKQETKLKGNSVPAWRLRATTRPRNEVEKTRTPLRRTRSAVRLRAGTLIVLRGK